MDGLLLLSSLIIVFALLGLLTVAFGVDSRDGFADESLRSSLS